MIPVSDYWWHAGGATIGFHARDPGLLCARVLPSDLGAAGILAVVLDTRDGTMTATLVNRDDAIVVSGNCKAM